MIKPVGDVYTKRFFAHRGDHSWRAPIVCSTIVETIPNVKRIIDCGCGDGDLVNEFLNMGLDAYGIEGTFNCEEVLKMPLQKLIVADLRLPLHSRIGEYDVALSLEVAEHIEEEFADTYVSNLCRLSDRVLISAAPPGQGGHGHVNCQPAIYWVAKFFDQRFQFNSVMTETLKNALKPWASKPGIKAYHQNLLYFARGEK